MRDRHLTDHALTSIHSAIAGVARRTRNPRAPALPELGAMSVPVVSTSRRESVSARPATPTLQLTLRWGLFLVLALAPLPLASVNPWAWSVLALAGGVLLAIAIIGDLVEPAPTIATLSLRVPMILAAIVVAWIAFQQFPVSSPDWNAALWDQAAKALGAPVMRSITLDRERSLEHLLRLLCYVSIFLVAWNVGRQAKGAVGVLRATALIGAAYSLYGLIVYFAGNATVLWFPKRAYEHDLTGTFVNRNSFAAFLGFCLLASVGVIAQTLADRVDGSSTRTLLRSSIDTALRHGIWAMLCLALTASALLLTHSRGGAIATLMGAAALVIAIMIAPSLRGPWRWPLAGFALLGAMIMIAVAGSGILGRLPTTAMEAGGRTEIYDGAVAAIAEHSVLGTGLGTFEFVYPPYQPQSELMLIEFAHNEYLQNALELGIPTALIFYAMLATLVARCIAGIINRRRNAIIPCVGIGVSTLAAVHSTIDFSMQMPAVAVTYAALLGVAVAQSVGSKVRGEGSSSWRLPG